jgi:hypothetical protein
MYNDERGGLGMLFVVTKCFQSSFNTSSQAHLGSSTWCFFQAYLLKQVVQDETLSLLYGIIFGDDSYIWKELSDFGCRWNINLGTYTRLAYEFMPLATYMCIWMKLNFRNEIHIYKIHLYKDSSNINKNACVFFQ